MFVRDVEEGKRKDERKMWVTREGREKNGMHKYNCHGEEPIGWP
jgi:hypothetical protein